MCLTNTHQVPRKWTDASDTYWTLAHEIRNCHASFQSKYCTK